MSRRRLLAKNLTSLTPGTNSFLLPIRNRFYIITRSSAIIVTIVIYPPRCGKGKISFLSRTEYLLSTEWKGILKIILKLSSCQASLLYLSIVAPRLCNTLSGLFQMEYEEGWISRLCWHWDTSTLIMLPDFLEVCTCIHDYDCKMIEIINLF